MDMTISEELAAETLAADNTPQALRERRAALEKQMAEVDAKLGEELKAAKLAAIADIKTLMQDHGITLADLDAKPAKIKAGAKPRKVTATRQPGIYTHPDGRSHIETAGKKGRRPGWLDDAGVVVS